MSTSTNPSPLGIQFFQGDLGIYSLLSGLEALGLLTLVLTLLLAITVSNLVAQVVVSRLFPAHNNRTVVVVIALIFLLMLMPLLEAVGGGIYQMDHLRVGSLIFGLTAELMLPVVMVLAVGFGLLEILRYAAGVRLDADVKRMMVVVSFLFLFAVSGPLLQRVTGERVREFIADNLKVGE